MKIHFSDDEMITLMTSLITRRNWVKDLSTHLPEYQSEVQKVDLLMARLFPDTLKILEASEKAA